MIITGKKFSKPAMSRVINGDVKLETPDQLAPRKRLDLILVEKYPEFNRSTLQNFIRSGYVTVNGKIITKPNAEIALEAPKSPSEPVSGETADLRLSSENALKIALNVPKRETPPDLDKIFEDDNVLVINKPAGLLSMAKGEFTTEPTLEDYGLLVHRLDRDTSGVVILAKNEATRKDLRNQFQNRKTHKTYFAIVEGRPKLDTAKIDLPIARNMKRPTTFIVDASGKPSQTYYNVVELLEKDGKTYSLVELKPVTGRTHQLRVHLKYLGHPILGDRVYGNASGQTGANHNASSQTNRLYLHAASLEITIPGPERRIFTAPLPKEFEDFLSSCKRTKLKN